MCVLFRLQVKTDAKCVLRILECSSRVLFEFQLQVRKVCSQVSLDDG